MIYNSQIYVPDLRNRCCWGQVASFPFWHRLQLSSQGKVHQGDAPLEQRQLGKSHRNRGFTLCKVVPQFGIAKLVQNGELWSNSNFTNWFMVGILTYLLWFINQLITGGHHLLVNSYPMLGEMVKSHCYPMKKNLKTHFYPLIIVYSLRTGKSPRTE